MVPLNSKAIDPYYPLVYNTSQGITYFPKPYSADPLPSEIRHAIIVLGIVGALSVGCTLSLITFLVYRMMAWRIYYKSFLGYNQYVVLVMNLVIADLQQSSSFLISFYWLKNDYIISPTPACFAQGWLLHSGDVANAFFVLAVAVHTVSTAVYGHRISTRAFYCVIFCIWMAAYLLTYIGVILHGQTYFTRAGTWCWISPAYQTERLFCHYFWVFLVQFGSVALYVITFISLRRKTKGLFHGMSGPGSHANAGSIKAVNRVTNLMMLYPCVYIVLTLPLSACRMWQMQHPDRSLSVAAQCTAGALICSCGWVDTMLYTLTRKRLLQETMPNRNPSGSGTGHTNLSRGSAVRGSFEGIRHTRTVTVSNQDGQMYPGRDRAFCGSTSQRASDAHDSVYRSPLPSDMLDPIFSGKIPGGGVSTEISTAHDDVSSDDTGLSSPNIHDWEEK